MKNLSLILNLVLLAAVSVLFYLHFGARSVVTDKKEVAEIAASTVQYQMAFINSDSVLRNYDYFNTIRKQLEDKTRKYDQEFRNRAQGLQNEMTNYQRNAQNLTIGQARAVEEDLMKKEQNLRLYQESLTQDLMAEEAKMNQELYKRITDFLKEFGQERGLQIVFKYDTSSDVLYAGEGLDITNEVIAGLNETYKREKEGISKPAAKSAAKPDTTSTK
ncbi:MAG TPA: OmpH family outer membrane protein [Cyclobacteriaceae bacterium]|nr:OmpH family outer membrane protein [Cyclobacteriaceae bacterium]